MSSAWVLGWTVMLGLGTDGKTFENLSQRGECVLNFPSDDLWQSVERLAPLTGKENIPAHKQAKFCYVKDKFSVAGLSPLPSKKVLAPRVAECPLQMEALVRHIHLMCDDDIAAVQVEILQVHAHENIVRSPNHIDPQKWQPLIYNFRHYFGLGQELGKSFRSET
jgi:flavin reductase (DIM6/NTAB) family NADH-FMN oxidoreductase RutF